MRRIKVSQIKEAVKVLSLEANLVLRRDVLAALVRAEAREKGLAREVLSSLRENARIARKERLPICQDTGMAVVFFDLGDRVEVVGGNLIAAINQGIREGYGKGYLRKSVVDPLSRSNTRDNTPAVIHFDIIRGDKVKITVVPKGFGSENCSKIQMMKPTATIEEIKDFVAGAVREAGANPCPPLIVGVGIGGTLEKAVLLSKKATLQPLSRLNPKKELARLEQELLRLINRTGIGPLGFGGKTTALGVKALDFPTHIAGLPVAVHLSCHASRSAKRVI